MLAFIAKVQATPIAVYAAAVLGAHWNTGLSLVLFVAVPAFFIVPNRFVDRRLSLFLSLGQEQ